MKPAYLKQNTPLLKQLPPLLKLAVPVLKHFFRLVQMPLPILKTGRTLLLPAEAFLPDKPLTMSNAERYLKKKPPEQNTDRQTDSRKQRRRYVGNAVQEIYGISCR